MERGQVVVLLTEWAELAQGVESALDNLRQAFGGSDGTVGQALSDTLKFATRMTADAVGAKPWPEDGCSANDLEYFQYECSFGEHPRTIHINGQARPLDSVESLADLILGE